MNKPPHFFEQRKVRIAVFFTAVFLYWTSLYLYVPTLPVYVEGKVDDLALVGVVLSMYGLWQLLVRLPVGIASDRIGKRKPFILIGFLLSALGAVLLGFANNFGSLATGRAVTGLAAATWVPLVVAFSTLFKPSEAIRATAILTISGSVSRMLATGITGTLNDLGGYRLPFLLAAGAALLAFLVILVEHEPKMESRVASTREVLGVIRRRDVLLPSLLSAVAQYISWTATFGFLPILARRYGASDLQLSLLTSMNIAILLVGNLLLTFLLKHLGAKRLLYISFFLGSGGIFLASLAGTLTMVFVSQSLLGLSFGIGSPVMMGKSIEKVENGQRSTAMGLHQSVYAVGMFAGPWLSGILAERVGIQPMFAITAVATLTLALIGLQFIQEN